jgi:2-polyprenyl-3-methyl-5-hydroxy-6-metoxy-1,4-benzoquinol methylase
MEFDRFAGDYEKILDRSVAASGEESAYFAEYKARYLARVVPPALGGRVLDFGCGVGLLAGFLARYLAPARLDGFDVSEESVRRVDPALAGRGVFTADAGRLASDYGLIVAANVLHHVARAERQETLRSLAGRLAPHGRLALFEHNPANPVTRRVVERCPFDDGVELLPPKESSRYLETAGLRVVRRDYIVFLPRALAWLRPLEPRLAWLPLGAQYAMIGEKEER